ncbi:clathrin adaptor complexes medium subunit family protein [Actinidia rufa]|uniref:Clathrin adaptor complexes medium subunit family protein n=1 Tax=Actinidia rufa TaxID=165716 RepID=A0A7J0DWK5_9ERIC|nr:clathrin adaptor complexes medium subunit family protein [Actinidia rufa]
MLPISIRIAITFMYFLPESDCDYTLALTDLNFLAIYAIFAPLIPIKLESSMTPNKVSLLASVGSCAQLHMPSTLSRLATVDHHRLVWFGYQILVVIFRAVHRLDGLGFPSIRQPSDQSRVGNLIIRHPVPTKIADQTEFHSASLRVAARASVLGALEALKLIEGKGTQELGKTENRNKCGFNFSKTSFHSFVPSPPPPLAARWWSLVTLQQLPYVSSGCQPPPPMTTPLPLLPHHPLVVFTVVMYQKEVQRDILSQSKILERGWRRGSTTCLCRIMKILYHVPWSLHYLTVCPMLPNVDGVNYFHVKVVGLLFVATTRTNVSPSLVLELLQRIARVIKDYLGVLNEDSFRKNFVLVYELLDEVVDFGYVQTTSTEVLKSYVFNEPILVDAARLQTLGSANLFMQGSKRMPGTAITKSVVANEPGGRKREEIFVDIIEKISVTFSSSVGCYFLVRCPLIKEASGCCPLLCNFGSYEALTCLIGSHIRVRDGYILTSEIDGTIQMKSYLTGNPEIRLALNEELSIGRGGRSIYDYSGSSGSGAVILDDCNFHESVHLDSFDMDRTLTLVPSDGEFPVMNYRMTQEFKPPFRINALIEEAGPLKAEVILKIRAEFASSITANTIIVQMPLPTYTARVSFELEPGAVGTND